jgi:hypothetical protein
MNLFENIKNVYLISSLIMSIGLFIAALEDLSEFKIFEKRGLLSWSISRLSAEWKHRGLFSKILHFLLNDIAFKVNVFARIVGSLLLFILSCLGIVSPATFCVLFFLNALISFRNPYGLDGAYQMYLILLFGFTIGSLSGIDSVTSKICIAFIAGQLICSYVIAGYVKLISPVWRKGYALPMIFSTACYGHPSIYKLVTQYPAISCFLSWSTILFECSFFLILILPQPFALCFLFMGFLFHFANALFMGLNDFLFAFVTAYPSMLYLLFLMS